MTASEDERAPLDWSLDYVRYLEAKERIDDRAIHCELWERFTGFLHSQLSQGQAAATRLEPLRIIDVGAGIGSPLFRLLASWEHAEALEQVRTYRRGVEYWAVDLKSQLLRALLQRLQSVAASNENPWQLERYHLETNVVDHSNDDELHQCLSGFDLHRAADRDQRPACSQAIRAAATGQATRAESPAPVMDMKTPLEPGPKTQQTVVVVGGGGGGGAQKATATAASLEHTRQHRAGETTGDDTRHVAEPQIGPGAASVETRRFEDSDMPAGTPTTDPQTHHASCLGSAKLVLKASSTGFYLNVHCYQGDAETFCTQHPGTAEVLWASSFFDLLLNEAAAGSASNLAYARLRAAMPRLLATLKPYGVFYFPLHYDGMTYWLPNFDPSSAAYEAEQQVLAAFHRSLNPDCTGFCGQALLDVIQDAAISAPAACDCTFGYVTAGEVSADEPALSSAGVSPQRVPRSTQQTLASDSLCAIRSGAYVQTAAGQRLAGPHAAMRPMVTGLAPSTWCVQPFAGLGVYLPSTDAYFLECILKLIGGAAWSSACTASERARIERWYQQRREQLQQRLLTYVAHNIDLLGIVIPARIQTRAVARGPVLHSPTVCDSSMAPVLMGMTARARVPAFAKRIEPVGVFSYGTLQSPRVLQTILGRIPRSVAAVLNGYRVHGVRDESYPAVAKSAPENAPHEAVPGVLLLELTAADHALLDAYEGPQYQKLVEEVQILPLGMRLRAFVYVWKSSTDNLVALPNQHWDLDAWTRTHEQSFCQECSEWIRTFKSANAAE